MDDDWGYPHDYGNVQMVLTWGWFLELDIPYITVTWDDCLR